MDLNAKNSFKEGWVMLRRPHQFAGLKNPLQQLSILYAYSERPLFDIELNAKGKEITAYAKEAFGAHVLAGYNQVVGGYTWSKRVGETPEEYDERYFSQWDMIIKNYSTVEVFQGNIVQCFIDGKLCRFYPEEYKIIGQDSFQSVLNGEDYFFMIENEIAFDTKHIKDNVHYLRSRGIPKKLAQRFASSELKDNVWFKPKPPILSVFVRDENIYLPDTDYAQFFKEHGFRENITFQDFKNVLQIEFT